MADEVTAAQAATLTGLSERTIRRRILSGQLSARRLSANRYAIRVEDLPVKGGGATVIARLTALDERVHTLEGEVASLRATLTNLVAAQPTPAEAAEAPSLDQLRALLSQLGQETERLAPLLGFPPATTAPRPTDGPTAASAEENGSRRHTRSNPPRQARDAR